MLMSKWNEELFKFLHLYEGPLAQGLVWLIFLIFAIGVVIGAKYMSEYLVAWTARWKIKQSVAGSLILATITSLPELTIAFTMGATNNPQQSLANTIGGNAYYLTIFSIILLIFFNKNNLTKVSKWNKILLYMGGLFALILFLALIPQAFASNTKNWLPFMTAVIPGINISWIFVLFLILYITIMALFLKSEKQDESFTYDAKLAAKGTNEIPVISNDTENLTAKELKNHLTVKKVFILFICFAILLVFCAFCLGLIVGITPHVYKIPETSVGGLLLSIVTNTPELISTFILLRMGKTNLAFGGLTGTLLFNTVINFFSDATFNSGGSLNFLVNTDPDYLQYFMISFLQLILIILTIVKVQKFSATNKTSSIFLNIIIIIIFIAFWILNLTLIAHISRLGY